MDELKSVVNDLLRLEKTNSNVYPVRRRVERIYHDWLKTGQLVPISHKYNISCVECEQDMASIMAYYCHLVAVHEYEAAQAEETAAEPEVIYQREVKELQELLNKYTDVQLEEPC